MKASNIYHRPQSEFAFALDDTNYIFRLRTAPLEADTVVFYFADRASMKPLEFQAVNMPLAHRDKHFDWYELRLKTEFNRISYYFELKNKEEKLYYFGDCYERLDVAERSDYFQLPFNHRADRLVVPEWAKAAIVYNIFPDSFANSQNAIAVKSQTKDFQGSESRALLGGTIKGICDNLPYIHEMGFNCVYLNPIFAAGCYHKYDTLDYFEVDPCMGTKDDLRLMINKAHSLGMRVILDGVFNHMSSEHPIFKDVLKYGKDSKYYDWFYELPEYPEFPKPGEEPGYTCFAYVPEMPKTNTANKEMQDYFIKVGTYWIDEFDIDGWRLDVANEVDDGFLRAFRKAVKQAKNDAIIVGEVWENAEHYLHGDMMDSAMNYDFRRYSRRLFADETVDVETFAANIDSILYRYREQATFAQLNLLDGHDVCRFLSLCDGNIDKIELAILFQMTFPGMPCVFYGDEKGMMGVSENEYRSKMEWDKKHELEDIYKKLIALRKDNITLRQGSYETLYAKAGILKYCRRLNNHKITVSINLSKETIDSDETGSLLLKKGSTDGIIKPMEYEVREEMD